MTRWNPRRYGSREDPIHQSDMSSLFGGYGCLRKFAFYKGYAAEHSRRYESERAYGSRELGTAVHETIARALRKHGARILAGEMPPRAQFEAVFADAFEQARAGREVVWTKKKEIDEMAAGVTMVMEGLQTLAARASRVILVEAPFICPIGGEDDPKRQLWIEGTIDLAFEDEDGRIHLADWKTGAQRPDRTQLDRGHQLGLYAFAMRHGTFEPHSEAPYELGAYPDAMWIAHLRDFDPYKKLTRKRPSTPEEAEFYGVDVGELVSVPKGGPRGPGWYASRRRMNDDGDLVHSLRSVVGTVRMGRTWKAIGDACGSCPFASECASEGFGPAASEKRHIEQALRGLEDVDCGLDEVA